MEDVLLAMDRLIYQTDTCRIFHFSNEIQKIAIKEIMHQFPNIRIWQLVVDANIIDDGYLIYNLRKGE